MTTKLAELKQELNTALLKVIEKDIVVGLRTMCGSRTGGWSLPCVMSD
jgi:hypothetical protein